MSFTAWGWSPVLAIVLSLGLVSGAQADTVSDQERLEATVQLLREQAGAPSHPDLARLALAIDDFSNWHRIMRAYPGAEGWRRMTQIRDSVEQSEVSPCAEDLKQAVLSCMQPGLASARTRAAELATRFGVCRIDLYKTRLPNARQACQG
ncbi:hypothetical protein [Niveibacterium terrae]|uniref:hypothetical protein n=1 Tax=Niveibacterium terrae TaxID=3373598 RepID=UPI003A90E0D8